MTAKGAREFRRRRRMIGIASAIDRCCMVRDQKGEKCAACEKLKVAPNFKHEKKSKKPRRLSPPSPFQLDPSPCSLPLSSARGRTRIALLLSLSFPSLQYIHTTLNPAPGKLTSGMRARRRLESQELDQGRMRFKSISGNNVRLRRVEY